MMQPPPHTFVRPPRGMPPKLERPSEPDYDRGIMPPNAAHIRPPPRDIRPPPSTSSVHSHLYASNSSSHLAAAARINLQPRHVQQNNFVSSTSSYNKPKVLPLPHPQEDAFNTSYDDPYICFKCDNWVVLYKDEQHPSRTMDQFCRYCDKTMSSKELIEVHTQCVHIISKRKRHEARMLSMSESRNGTGGGGADVGGAVERPHPVACRLCGVQFNSDLSAPPNDLESIKKSFQCNLCSRTFVTKDGLDIHSQVHTGASVQ